MRDRRTDAAVIAAADKTPTDFAVVFDRHFDTIHRYIDRRAGRGVADELSGEVFRIAFEQRRRFEPIHPSALPWLYGLATNLLLRHWRDTAREVRAVQLIRESETDSDLSGADARIDAEPLGRRLVAALAELPEADRDVVVLIAWEDLSYEEVATALAIPVGTVRSRLSRARRALLTVLDGEESATALRLATGKDAR